MEKNLPEIAKAVRRDILEMIFASGGGHLAGSLSSTDLLVALHFGILRNNDKFVLSAGHYCPAYYAVLAEAGLLPKEELKTYQALGSRLQGHPHNLTLPGLLLTSSGPLGQGLSLSAGMALALRLDSGQAASQSRVYCLMSDAEQAEGQVWEAAEFAAKYKLDNLVGIIDKNGIQVDGFTQEVMPLGDLSLKYRSFGWEVFEIDGHIFGQTIEALESVKSVKDKPVLVIARTMAGKGVSFMEGKWEWHHGKLTEKQLKQALDELR